MKHLVTAILALLILAPSLASACGSYGPGMFVQRDLSALRLHTEEAEEQGALTTWESAWVRARIERVQSNYIDARSEGFDPAEGLRIAAELAEVRALMVELRDNPIRELHASR